MHGTEVELKPKGFTCTGSAGLEGKLRKGRQGSAGAHRRSSSLLFSLQDVMARAASSDSVVRCLAAFNGRFLIGLVLSVVCPCAKLFR